MAEKTTKKAPAAAAAAATPATQVPAAAPKPTTVDIFRHVKNPAEGEKLAPQARVIVNVLGTYPQGLKRDDLVKALDGKITTRQPIGRIVTYYQKSLVDSGYITIETVEVAKAA